jgi:hypothetical protein
MKECIQPQEAEEAPQERTESDETTQTLDQATFEPEAEVENTGDYQQSEVVESVFQEVVRGTMAEDQDLSMTVEGTRSAGDQDNSSSAVRSDTSEVSTAEQELSLEDAAVQPGELEARQDPDGSNAWESMADEETDLHSVGELLESEEQPTATDTTGVQKEQMQAVETQSGSMDSTSIEGAEERSSNPAEREADPEGVLPGGAPSSAAGSSTAGVESPAAAHAVGGMDVPRQGGLDLESGDEEEDGAGEKEQPADEEVDTEGALDPEIVSQLMDQLPESAAEFTDQAAAEIVELTLADAEADFISPVRGAIQDQFQDLTPSQADGLLAASLLKAAESLNSVELPDQLPDTGAISGITPDFPGTNPADGGDTGVEPPPEGGQTSEDDSTEETDREAEGDKNQMDMLMLQDAMNKQQQLMQIMSNIQKMMHDTALAIIRNLK